MVDVAKQRGNVLKRLLAVLVTVFAGLAMAILAQSSAQATDNWSISGTVTDEKVNFSSVIPTGRVGVFGNAPPQESWYAKTHTMAANTIRLTQQPNTRKAALDSDASVTGTVRDDEDQVLAGVTVKAVGLDTATTVTDSNGTYSLDGLEPGSYHVRFKALGDLAGQWYDAADTKGEATLVTLASGENRSGVNARLRPARTIGGAITDPDGNPVSGVRVEVYADGNPYYTDRTRTDDQGVFRTHDLPEGKYDVYIRPSSPTRFGSQWYDKATTRGNATAVTVLQGQSVNIAASLEFGGEVRGRVADSSGIPIAGAYVSAERDNDYRYTRTDSEGNYAISGLTTGEYTVEFSADRFDYVSEWYDNKDSKESADLVTVTAGQSTLGIDARLARVSSISGTVSTGDGGTVTYPMIGLFRGTALVDLIFGGSDGTYTFRGVQPGEYTILTGGSGPWIDQWWKNKPDQASADRIVVAGGQNITGVDFRLERGATISGTLKDSNGQAVEGYVELMDTDGNQLSGAGTEEGSYTLVGLRGGSYYLHFRSYGPEWLSEWWQDESDLQNATPIVISVGEARAGFDAVLSPASKISGSMVDEQGMGVEGCITVFQGTTEHIAGKDCADESGRYVVGNLRAGDYQVLFDPGSDDFARQWWAGAPRRSMASTITLGDATTFVADAILQRGGTLTGVVTDDDGDPVGGVEVRAFTQESYYSDAAVTDSQGRYVMPGLDNDNYKLQAVPGSSRLELIGEWYDNRSSYSTATVVPVGNGATVSANFALEKGASISGTVSDGNGPVFGIGVDVFDLDGNKELTVWTNRRGEYTSTALEAGQYKVRFMPGYYGGDGLVEQWWNNKNTEAVANIIELGATQQKTGVNATLKAIGAGDTAPAAPTDVQVTPGDEQVTIRWKAPLDDGGLPITRYKVEGSPYGECETQGDLICTIKGLANGESYTFTVKASNSVGLSPASTPSASVIPFGKPKPPTAVKATAGTEKATVSWTPGFDNGRAISGYTVTSAPGGKICQTAGTTCDVTGLTGGTSYTFTVKATNVAGNSADSAASNAVTPVANPTPPVTPPTTPPPPSGAPPQNPPPSGGPSAPGEGTQPAPPAAPTAPGKIKAKSKSRKLTVTWAPVSGASKYQVRVNKGSKKGAWKTVSKPKFVSGKLKKGKYTVEVKAVGAGGAGPAKKTTVKVK